MELLDSRGGDAEEDYRPPPSPASGISRRRRQLLAELDELRDELATVESRHAASAEASAQTMRAEAAQRVETVLGGLIDRHAEEQARSGAAVETLLAGMLGQIEHERARAEAALREADQLRAQLGSSSTAARRRGQPEPEPEPEAAESDEEDMPPPIPTPATAAAAATSSGGGARMRSVVMSYRRQQQIALQEQEAQHQRRSLAIQGAWVRHRHVTALH